MVYLIHNHDKAMTHTQTAFLEPPAITALTHREKDLLVEHLPLVDGVVQGFRNRLAKHADFEELRSVGIIGLIGAVQKYDPEQQAAFKGYAILKIRGAILDELRRLDVMSRSSRKKEKELGRVVGELEQKLGRSPTDEELRKQLGLKAGEYEKLRRQTQSTTFISLQYRGEQEEGEGIAIEEKIADEGQELGFEPLEKLELEDLLAEALETLPDRSKKVLAFYYLEKLKLAEIAEIFEVSEARICQIHTQALAELKQRLGPQTR